MQYTVGMTGKTFWTPLTPTGHWAEPGSYSYGEVRGKYPMPLSVARQAIARAKLINGDGLLQPLRNPELIGRQVRCSARSPTLDTIHRHMMNKPDYHSQIMNLHCQEQGHFPTPYTKGYCAGHRDACHAAAELAAKADAIISELRSVIADVLKAFPDLEEYESSQGHSLSPLAIRLRSALASLPAAELQP